MWWTAETPLPAREGSLDLADEARPVLRVHLGEVAGEIRLRGAGGQPVQALLLLRAPEAVVGDIVLEHAELARRLRGAQPGLAGACLGRLLAQRGVGRTEMAAQRLELRHGHRHLAQRRRGAGMHHHRRIPGQRPHRAQQPPPQPEGQGQAEQQRQGCGQGQGLHRPTPARLIGRRRLADGDVPARRGGEPGEAEHNGLPFQGLPGQEAAGAPGSSRHVPVRCGAPDKFRLVAGAGDDRAMLVRHHGECGGRQVVLLQQPRDAGRVQRHADGADDAPLANDRSEDEGHPPPRARPLRQAAHRRLPGAEDPGHRRIRLRQAEPAAQGLCGRCEAVQQHLIIRSRVLHHHPASHGSRDVVRPLAEQGEPRLRSALVQFRRRGQAGQDRLIGVHLAVERQRQGPRRVLQPPLEGTTIGLDGAPGHGAANAQRRQQERHGKGDQVGAQTRQSAAPPGLKGRLVLIRPVGLRHLPHSARMQHRGRAMGAMPRRMGA